MGTAMYNSFQGNESVTRAVLQKRMCSAVIQSRLFTHAKNISYINRG